MKLKYLIAVATIGVIMIAPAYAQDTHPSNGTPPAGSRNLTGSTGGSTGGAMQNTPSHGDEGGAGPGGMGGRNQGMNEHSMEHGPGMENGDQVVSHHAMNGRGMDNRGMDGDHRGGMHHGRCRMVWHNHHRVRRCT